MRKLLTFLMALAVLIAIPAAYASENIDQILRKDPWSLSYGDVQTSFDFQPIEDNVWAYDNANGLTLELFGSKEKKGALNLFIKPDTSRHTEAYGPYGPGDDLNRIAPAAGIQLIFDLRL